MPLPERYIDLSQPTRWLRYLLYSYAGLAAAALVVAMLEHSLLSAIEAGRFASEEAAVAAAEASDARKAAVGLLQFANFLALVVLVARWVRRANHNAWQLGASNLSFTPNSSIAYYFVPVFNLWKPYQAMKEIWQASASPAEWPLQTVPALLPAWWTLWLLSNVLGQAVWRLSASATSVQQLLTLNVVTQLSDVSDVLLGLALAAIVTRVHTMQASQHQSTAVTPNPGEL